MFNLHLLQKKFTVKKYQKLIGEIDWSNPSLYFDQIPSYMITRCPFCLIENIERLDTYSIKLWRLRSPGRSVFDYRSIEYHCKHFTLVQPFFCFHGIWPTEAKGQFGPEVPHVIGHLLENYQCQAVIHALPICRIEDDEFVPRYTMFMVSYFSEQPEEVYQSVIGFNVDYVEPGIAWPFIAPPDGCEHWWDLQQWVSRGQLFWVNGDDPELGIRTGNVEDFPYGDIEGRTWPYLHMFPYPLPKPRKPK